MPRLIAPLVCLLVLAAPAAARDRDRDRLPDRWERAHGLKVGKRDARRDPDRDGLRNSVERRAGTHPRRADSDRDGVRDGDEIIGTIRSFTGGVLTVRLVRGGTASGRVDADTFVDCPLAGAAAQPPQGDEQADGDEPDLDLEELPDLDEVPDEDDLGEDDLVEDDLVEDALVEGEDEEESDDAGCGSGPLAAGRRVYGAELVDGAFALVELTR